MPTGYTFPVVDGTMTQFSEFAMTCARAFGACITMRDDPSDAPIPDEFKPSEYNDKRLAESRARLAEVEAMSVEQVAAACAEDFEKAKSAHEKYEREQEVSGQRLDQMLAKVNSWQPPTAEHVRFKEFMVEQLQISKRGDYRSPVPTPLTPTEWQRTQVEKLHHDIGYHAAEQAKEIERARGRTEWVKALRASL